MINTEGKERKREERRDEQSVQNRKMRRTYTSNF